MMTLAAISDEFSSDLGVALPAIARAGITHLELRVVNGRNILQLTDVELREVMNEIAAHGMTVIGIASPLFKWDIPGGPATDPRFQQDVFGASYTHADLPALQQRAFEVARQTGARLIRVFSYWRTVNPEACRSRIADTLHAIAVEAARHDILIGLENEFACNVATGAELAQTLDDVPHPHLVAIWDPANAFLLGERAYPDGYTRLPPARLGHVHAKDCTVDQGRANWGPIGEMGVDWKGQIAALRRDGYAGAISLETHWSGPGGNKIAGSEICAKNLAALLTSP
jgi:L-ribulose-5-phosphate 3-epimerase